MKYPNMDDYRKLYARYLSENGGRPVSELIDLAGDLTGKRVADLCGGAGEIAIESLSRGAAYVEIVDQELTMIDTKRFDSKIKYIAANPNGGVHVASMNSWCFQNRRTFDVLFCRQAVNYWLNERTAKKLRDRMNDGGQFIFNTFNKKPSTKPQVKSYKMNGLEYVEVSWLGARGVVQHVQWCTGMEPHTTEFKWIEPKAYIEMLTPYFDVAVKSEGSTDIYHCFLKQRQLTDKVGE